MPSLLDTTVGGVTSNSYCTLAEARAYYEDHPYANSDAAMQDDDILTRLLITATRLVDDGWTFDGWAASLTQRLAFPRLRLRNPRTRAYIPSTVIPDDIKYATALLAWRLNAADRTADNDVQTQGIKSFSAGSGAIAVEFTGVGGAKVMPDDVTAILALWGYLRNGRGVRRLVRA